MTSTFTTLRRSPLDAWIASLLGQPVAALSRSHIEDAQLASLQQTLQWARERSPFYKRHLLHVPPELPLTLASFRELPFTTPRELAEHSSEFVCVSQDEVARVVTLATSGTTGDPKRLFFTAAEQERALDFFEHGVSTLAAPGERMAIALPGEHPGSVGTLLAQGIERAGVGAIPCGVAASPAQLLQRMEREQATSIIGFPVQILRLVMQPGTLATSVFSRLRSIVLCSDRVSPAIVRRLRRSVSCEVFEHYGTTETGLGGGVDCEAHEGYHLREMDLLFEVVDPRTGEPLPAGETGEVVFTTLTRRAMPLIRYRTGDLSSFAPSPCSCGSVLRNLRRIAGRVEGGIPIFPGTPLTMAQLDDALFELPGVLDFSARLTPSCLGILCEHLPNITSLQDVRACLQQLPAIASAVSRGLELHVESASAPIPFHGAKRRIEVAA